MKPKHAGNVVKQVDEPVYFGLNTLTVQRCHNLGATKNNLILVSQEIEMPLLLELMSHN